MTKASGTSTQPPGTKTFPYSLDRGRRQTRKLPAQDRTHERTVGPPARGAVTGHNLSHDRRCLSPRTTTLERGGEDTAWRITPAGDGRWSIGLASEDGLSAADPNSPAVTVAANTAEDTQLWTLTAIAARSGADDTNGAASVRTLPKRHVQLERGAGWCLVVAALDVVVAAADEPAAARATASRAYGPGSTPASRGRYALVGRPETLIILERMETAPFLLRGTWDDEEGDILLDDLECAWGPRIRLSRR